jgi:hypothetical protein
VERGANAVQDGGDCPEITLHLCKSALWYASYFAFAFLRAAACNGRMGKMFARLFDIRVIAQLKYGKF